MKTMMAGVIMAGLGFMLCACAGTSLGDVRNTDPLQTATMQAETASLADCVKQRIESDSWLFGQPIVHSTQQSHPPATRVHAMYSRSNLFELALYPVAPSSTRVEYRRSYDGHGTQEQAWAIIERCASQTSLAKEHP